MKKILLYKLFFILTFSIHVSYSQYTIEWQKSLGGYDYDFGGAVVQTNDGGFVIAGYSRSIDGDVTGLHFTDPNHTNYDFWIVKLSSKGVIEWQKCLGGSYSEKAFSIIQTNDGGFIVAGSSDSNDGDVSGHHGIGDDFWIVKLDNTGSIGHAPGIEWQKCLGGTDNEYDPSIKQTIDGGFIIVGSSYSNDGDVSGHHGKGLRDIWVVKLDNTGSKNHVPGIEWQKSLGGTANDDASDIIQINDGGYIVIGETDSDDGDVAGNHGSEDIWVVKLDNTGSLGKAPDIEWQKCFGGTSVERYGSILQTIDGGLCFVAGAFSNDGDVSGNHGLYDYWVVKLDNTGAKNHPPDIEWQKCLGGSQYDQFPSIIQTSDGGYFITGESNSKDQDVTGHHGQDMWSPDLWVVKLDNTGIKNQPPNIEWQKSLGGSHYELYYFAKIPIVQTADGGFIIICNSSSTDGDVTGNHGGGYDIWVVKLGIAPIETCPNRSQVITANPANDYYQWQVDDGSGFKNITDNANYVGTATDKLQLKNILSSWNGYKYRCMINGGGQYSTIVTLKVSSHWNGAVDNKWETAGNWSCGIVPDKYTDVYISSGKPRYPVVTTNGVAECKSLTVSPGTSFNVNATKSIKIYGH